MFAICVFRRFGLAVPISFVVIGCLLEVTLDKKHGGGYYSSHLWALGLNLLLTGIITAIISCIVNPPSTTSGGYSSLLDLSDGVGEKVQEVGNDMRESLEHFLTESSEEDMFCHIPLNRCSLVLIALGILFLGMDPILSK